MSQPSDAHVGVIMIAFVMGAVAGVAVGLLLAPAPGEDTRRVLNERAREGRGMATAAARQGAEFVRRQREQISTAIDRGRAVYQRAHGEEAAPAVEDNG